MMATLTLNRIYCHHTTSGPGDDDVYIKVDGLRVWGEAEMGDEDGEDIDVSKNFGTKVKVSVWDADDAPSPDDFLGAFWAHKSQANTGEQAEVLTGDGSYYDIYYEVS
ncbi:hypothetical protein ADL34_33570 [Streptomyces sp. NRRL WC-3605]|nr:hypothetical protein ADL33_34315 [Streptomyces sp. NRRL WC-3604]KUL68069.1 hypothetical protein ADL34_33570 [Streptomyces sp. NRRL WC-3605]